MATKTKLLPGKHNFQVYRGDSFDQQLTRYTDEARTTPRDLTGYTARMQLRNAISNEVEHELTTENGGITLGGVAGTVDLHIDKADMAGLNADNLYDLEFTDSSDKTRTLLVGSFVVVDDVTV